MVVNDNACLLVKRSALDSIASLLAPTKLLTEQYWLQMLVLSWSRGIGDALLQTIRIRTAAFAVINVAIGVEINVRTGPCWDDVYAVSEIFIVPPRDLHEKLLIWKQKTMIPCAAAWREASFVNPVLHIPDEPQFVNAALGVMDDCGRQHNNSPEDNQ
ncbi:hypothetical protein [Pseudomonas laurylsulfatiphila]|uniref:hypothetical protein n=1 Tax=Pseudomonas laurylsulfatiphila TaxID=2011015 RepID=UPI003D25889C